jgi:hypothetical protein
MASREIWGAPKRTLAKVASWTGLCTTRINRQNRELILGKCGGIGAYSMVSHFAIVCYRRDKASLLKGKYLIGKTAPGQN